MTDEEYEEQMSRLRRDLRDVASAVRDGLYTTCHIDRDRIRPRVIWPQGEDANRMLAALGWTIGTDSSVGAEAGPCGRPHGRAHDRIRAIRRIHEALERDG